jgi:hypothetical protein
VKQHFLLILIPFGRLELKANQFFVQAPSTFEANSHGQACPRFDQISFCFFSKIILSLFSIHPQLNQFVSPLKEAHLLSVIDQSVCFQKIHHRGVPAT